MLVVCAAGLSGSAAAAAAVNRVQQHRAGELMDQYADDVSQAVESEVLRYRDTLSDMAAAIAAESYFTAADFTQITSQLSRRRLSGALGVAFAVPAAGREIAAVQAFWRAQGMAGLRLEPVGTSVEHVLIVLNHPLDGPSTALGRDLSQAPQPLEALGMSRAGGQVTASHTYILITDRGLAIDRQQMSFMLAAPVFAGPDTPDSGRFRGWVIMGIRGGDFMDETLRTRSRGAVSVTLVDLSVSQPKIVASTGLRASLGRNPLDRERQVTVGLRTWELRVYPTATLLSTTERRRVALTLGLGVLVTLLLTALVAILTGARNRALTRVDRATAALRDDIERRKATEARLVDREHELRHLAFHDPLTGLANRTLFHERVEHALDTHSRSADMLAVLFIDLDGFKQINDAWGHSAGDAVLTEVALRLSECARVGDTVARFGGDEFALLAEQLAAAEDAESVAARTVLAIQHPFDINGQICRITASVGVALREPGGQTADAILRSADEAMYLAKTAGKGCYMLAEQATKEFVPHG